MSKSKEEIVSELYALRAGLSVISGQADEVRGNVNRIEEMKEQINDADHALAEVNRVLNQAHREYDDCRRVYEDETSGYEQTVKKETRKKMKDYNVLFGLLWATGFFVLAFTVLSIVSIATDMFPKTMTVWFVLADIVLISGDTLYYVLNYKKYEKQVKTELDKSIFNLESAMRSGEAAIQSATQKRDALVKEKSEAEARMHGEMRELRAQSKEIVEQSDDVYAALESTFAKQLNPADWQNVDLIIFHLQTGRADTIKESLQLVDRQRQTDEIVSTIKQASDRICVEIRNGIGALGKTMVTCFNSISDQIGAISVQLENRHTQTMQALDAVHRTNAELLSSTQLNNALQAKANTTNEQLMADVKYMQSRLGLNY